MEFLLEFYNVDNLTLLFFITCFGISVFFAPLIFTILIIRFIVDRIRRVKRINNLVISRYAYNSLRNDAVLTDKSINQRITRIVNFVAGQEELISRIRDH